MKLTKESIQTEITKLAALEASQWNARCDLINSKPYTDMLDTINNLTNMWCDTNNKLKALKACVALLEGTPTV